MSDVPSEYSLDLVGIIWIIFKSVYLRPQFLQEILNFIESIADLANDQQTGTNDFGVVDEHIRSQKLCAMVIVESAKIIHDYSLQT